MIKLRIIGHVPNKKGNMGAMGQKIWYRPGVRADLNGLVFQAQAQWRRPHLVSPNITVRFGVKNRRSDKNNKMGTILDVLVTAGVLKDDNMVWCNGRECCEPAVVVGRGENEWTEIELEEVPQ